MSNTNATLATTNRAAYNGIAARTTGRGIDATEQRIERLTEAATRTKENYCLMQYDIPDVSGVANPSDMLWNHGFRMTLSCWFMPMSQLQHPDVVELMATFAARGCKCRIIEQAESQRAYIESIAQEELSAEIRRAHAALITNIGTADDRLRELTQDICGPLTLAMQARRDAVRDNRVRAIIREAAEQLDRSIRCASIFDETENVADLLEGLRAAVASRAASFNADMRAKGAKLVSVPTVAPFVAPAPLVIEAQPVIEAVEEPTADEIEAETARTYGRSGMGYNVIMDPVQAKLFPDYEAGDDYIAEQGDDAEIEEYDLTTIG